MLDMMIYSLDMWSPSVKDVSIPPSGLGLIPARRVRNRQSMIPGAVSGSHCAGELPLEASMIHTSWCSHSHTPTLAVATVARQGRIWRARHLGGWRALAGVGVGGGHGNNA